MAFCLMNCCEGNNCHRQDDHGGDHACKKCDPWEPPAKKKQEEQPNLYNKSKLYRVTNKEIAGDWDHPSLVLISDRYHIDVSALLSDLGLDIKFDDEIEITAKLISRVETKRVRIKY